VDGFFVRTEDSRYNKEMKNRRLFTFAACLFFLTSIFHLTAAEISVTYLDGKLEYLEGRDTWKVLDIGDSFPGGRMRLSGRGFAELTSEKRRVSLTRDGLYESSELFGDVKDKSGVFQAVGSKFSLLNNRPAAQNTAAAVRAEVSEGEDFISWEDEYDSPLDEGIALFAEGEFERAEKAFSEGVLSESGAVQRECSYRKALCQLNLGEPREARQNLVNLKPEPKDPYIHEYTVMMAALYIESMEYPAADIVLASYLKSYPRGEAAQASWLLSAYSLESQGDMAGRRANLQKAVELGPKTEIGMKAAEMLR
jgi:tetratricopeptide (TPR) repeat protein